MIQVTVLDDPGRLFEQALDTKTMDYLMMQVGEAVAHRWKGLAAERLTSSRQQYISGIQVPYKSNGAVVVELKGELPNMIEQGATPFQMQETMLKEGEDHKVIPFRHGTPGSRGTQSPRMGFAYAADGPLSKRRKHFTVGDPMAVGKKVYKAAKALGPGQELPVGLVPKLRPHHSTDLYAGMQRMGDKGHTQYRTFRTISREVTDKWLHPGITPRNLGLEVAEQIQEMVNTTVSGYLAGLMGGTKG